jgi:hypothetical protein
MPKKKSIKEFIFIFCVLVLMVIGCFIASRAFIIKETEEYQCDKIDKNEDSVFIRFEKIEEIKEGGKTRKLIWLRLVNNTTSEIVLLSTGGAPVRIGNGRLTTDVEEGGPVSVYYELETDKGKKPPYFYDNLFVFRIRGGYSFIFSIPEDQIKKSYEVIIPFRYSWEQSTDSYPVRLEIRYCWAWQDDLPESIRRIAKKKKIERPMKIKFH